MPRVRNRMPVAVLCGVCMLITADGSAGRTSSCFESAAGTIAFERAIFLTDESGSDVTDVWVVQADGSGQRNLTGGDRVFLEGRPAWSPDGRSIAYVSVGDRTGIHVMDANGGRVRRVTGTYAWDPTWSPSGLTLAVASNNTPVPDTRVGVVSVRGGSVRWLTPRGLDSGEPDWSSTGQIAFIQRTGRLDVTMEVFVMSAAVSAKRRLTRNREQEATPAWSPDGTRIAYHTDRGIYVMNADGSGARRLTRGPRDFSPAWSPDGRCIAFSHDGSDIFVMSLAGGASRRLMTRKPRRAFDGSPSWASSSR